MARRLSVFIALLLLASLAQFSWGQTAEIGWQVTDPKFAKAIYAQSDFAGHLYVIKQNPSNGTSTSATFDVYDIYGNLVRSVPLPGSQVFTGLVVAIEAGTAAIGLGDGFEEVYWDGFGGGANLGVAPLAMAMDGNGNLTYVYDYPVMGQTVVNNSGTSWTVPFLATGAQIDWQGNVLLLGSTGSLESGTVFANYYTATGTSLWTRSFPNSVAGRASIAGFASDPITGQSLLINHSAAEIDPQCYVIAIDATDPSTDAWQSPNIPGSANSMVDNYETLVIAGQSAQPFVDAIATSNSSLTPGSIAWKVTQPNDSMILNRNDPLVSYYDSASKSENLIDLSSESGAVTSTISIPAPDPTDVGAVVPSFEGVEYIGSTGGSAPSALFVHVVYGSNLQSLVLPASVPGGSQLPIQVNLTESPAPEFITAVLDSSVPNVVRPLAEIQPFSETQTYQLFTYPVDSDTNVTITGSQIETGAVKSATVKVTTATLATVTCGSTTFNPSQTATGTVTLSGPTGPSGKTITLVSSDPSITVPATVKVLAGQTAATFTLTSHPVGVVTNPSITASLASQSSTLTVQVMPAPLKSLSVSPTSVTAGATTTGEVIISTQAGTSGDVVTIKSNTALAVVPASVTIPAGGTYTTFAIKTGGVSAPTTVTISAIFGAVTKFASFTVEPATLAAVVISPTSVKGGANAGATVHLTGPAGPSVYTVTLKSSNIAVTVPVSLTFPAGTSSFSFVLKTNTVKFGTPVTITATLGAVTKTASLTLTP